MLRRGFPWSRTMPEPDKGVFVEGEKVVLREKTIEDAADDYEWRVDDELASLDATRPLNMSYKDFLKYTGDELALPNPRSKRLAIDTADGKHIGNCMYYDIDIRKGETEIGIMIDREYWNKGVWHRRVRRPFGPHLHLNSADPRLPSHPGMELQGAAGLHQGGPS